MFKKILIANRGAIATRIIRTLQQMGIRAVAIYAEADRDSLHVSTADEAFSLGEGRAADTYLNQQRILEIARETGAEAIHPGYGFLSENHLFAANCMKNGIIFIGPNEKTLKNFSDKGKAKKLAQKLGIPQGIPIAVGALDAHVGAIGAEVGSGKFVKIMGTSTCDIMAFPEAEAPTDFEGVSGIVKGSVLPGYIGVEAGQAAVGDLLNWWVQNILNKEASYHIELSLKASDLKVGASGLLALDWNNGNRNILSDQQLSGLVLGQTLATKDYEIYRALIEATAFGALKIIECIRSQGISINEIIATGGIGHKNPLFMQIYADVIDCPVRLVENPQTVAVGAAIMAAYCVKKGAEGFTSVEEMINRLSVASNKVYLPNKEAHQPYKALFKL